LLLIFCISYIKSSKSYFWFEFMDSQGDLGANKLYNPAEFLDLAGSIALHVACSITFVSLIQRVLMHAVPLV
jgi:hypothetical protein